MASWKTIRCEIKCRKCGKKFYTANSIIEHLRIHYEITGRDRVSEIEYIYKFVHINLESKRTFKENKKKNATT